jgi:hypothetical protein
MSTENIIPLVDYCYLTKHCPFSHGSQILCSGLILLITSAETTNAIPGLHFELTPIHQPFDHPFDAVLYPYSLPSNFDHPGHRRKIKG